MNMHSSVQAEPETIDTPTPADHVITPRDRRFGREDALEAGRWWLGEDPIATAFYNSLSLTFPRGEAFFIESVKAFRDVTPEKLQQEIRAFVKQEILHTREHVALNRRVAEAGYDTGKIDKRVAESLALTKDRPAITNLAATMILEHFTAIMAQQFIANPKHFKNADAETASLWRWHALEEIEHKGVAYDTWLYATRDWSRWQRWKVKTLMMLIITRNFWTNRYKDSLDLLAQDGFTGFSTKAKLLKFLLFSPGVARKVIIPWVKFFLPGFHPWNEDDRHLINMADSAFAAARPDETQPA
ncbi:MAG: metal-dependent hydrolase [Parasphingorhabdus sp.]|uniref:metal-dependent hydrolase n=1 Tax=Parasphingorhabdus sp. TaxID=2709688 RepID=UPI0032981A0C